MGKRRGHIPLKTQLAAALCQVGQIPHEHAKLMTEDQIISLFDRDHYPIRKTDGGPDAHWNIVWRFRPGHKFKTNVDNGTGRSDQTDIARDRQIAKNYEEFRRRLLAKATGEPAPEKKRSQFPQGRKLRSRGFEKRKPKRTPTTF